MRKLRLIIFAEKSYRISGNRVCLMLYYAVEYSVIIPFSYGVTQRYFQFGLQSRAVCIIATNINTIIQTARYKVLFWQTEFQIPRSSTYMINRCLPRFTPKKANNSINTPAFNTIVQYISEIQFLRLKTFRNTYFTLHLLFSKVSNDITKLTCSKFNTILGK